MILGCVKWAINRNGHGSLSDVVEAPHDSEYRGEDIFLKSHCYRITKLSISNFHTYETVPCISASAILQLQLAEKQA